MDFWEAAGPQIDQRSIFSIHHESVTLIVGSDSGINSINDLSGKIVNIGPPNCGGPQNAVDVMTYFGIDYQTDITATEYNLSEAFVKFHKYEIDAIFITIGHPSSAVLAETQGARQIFFVPIVNIDGFLASFPYYVKSQIPVHHYPLSANTTDVMTFGLKATFVTSVSMADSTVYAFAKEIFENFRDFQKLHPVYEILTKNDMMQGLTAPIHPGAMKYLKEVIFIYPTKECPGDLDNNGFVDGNDLAGMAADFGNVGCQIP